VELKKQGVRFGRVRLSRQRRDRAGWQFDDGHWPDLGGRGGLGLGDQHKWRRLDIAISEQTTASRL
jgi:hypothetical protein